MSSLVLPVPLAGAGKTFIASKVIDSFLLDPTQEKLAYFYCDRAEENRRVPESILNTLIQQLAQTSGPDGDTLLSPAVDIYKKREKIGQKSSRLGLTESQELLVQLTDMYPQTTICIDALDEVEHEIRPKLLSALKHVVNTSKTLVKIFATTRMDTDILLQFQTFPRIEMQPDDNRCDIVNYIEAEVQNVIERKQLLHGVIPPGLKVEIRNALCKRSKGM
jgi:hypothetical protein